MDLKNLNSLKHTREQTGLTQKDVEDALGMRSLMMRDYEIGRLKLPVSVALKLANLYRVSVDELVGNTNEQGNPYQSKVLVNFNSLFLGNGFSVMFLDPVLKAFLEDQQEKYFFHSIFELLTEQYSLKKRKEIIIEICKCLFSLASSDGKISQEEIRCIRYLLMSFNIHNKYKEILQAADKTFSSNAIPQTMERIEIRHFTIWILFFFAFADGSISHKELSYIEKCAETLKMNKSNFIYIKEKFTTEIL